MNLYWAKITFVLLYMASITYIVLKLALYRRRPKQVGGFNYSYLIKITEEAPILLLMFGIACTLIAIFLTGLN